MVLANHSKSFSKTNLFGSQKAPNGYFQGKLEIMKCLQGIYNYKYFRPSVEVNANLVKKKKTAVNSGTATLMHQNINRLPRIPNSKCITVLFLKGGGAIFIISNRLAREQYFQT